MVGVMKLSVCTTDADYEAWRGIRIAVVPGERCDTVAEVRAQQSSSRLLLLAVMDGTAVGSGMADRSELAGGGFIAPQVLERLPVELDKESRTRQQITGFFHTPEHEFAVTHPPRRARCVLSPFATFGHDVPLRSSAPVRFGKSNR
jgi:hypothetical protein